MRTLAEFDGFIARVATETYPLDPPWLSNALVFISGEACNGISARDAYDHLGRSHTVVSRAFANALGTTVQQTIARARIDATCSLMRTTQLPVSAIAKCSGFASYTYFMHAFAAAFGVSPTLWRKSFSRTR